MSSSPKTNSSVSSRKYRIQPLVWLLQDEQSVAFHVQNDDYFGTIATVISLIKQKIKKECPGSKKIDQALNNLEKDLLHLQKHYQISAKK